MGVLRITKYWAVDDDRLVIWSFEGAGESAYNELVKHYGVKEVVINTGKNSVIPSSIFDRCRWIESVVIKDGVTSIGDHAFYGCSKLTSVTIPDGVTSIGPKAFQDCKGLTSVMIPDSVTSIGESAFYNNNGLTSVTIGSGVTSIGLGAFSGCSALTKVTIPDSVTSIGSYAFCGCSSLTSVRIGDSVTDIGDYIFYDCSNLKNISIPALLQINIRTIADPSCAITRRLKKEANMTETNNTEKRKDVDLYDPKFVHFDWDGSLMSKKGFYNDDMGSLKVEIRNEGARMMGTLIDCYEDSAPFLVQSSSNDHPSAWKFFYHDPNFEIKWAYFKEGKPIQMRREGTEWFDVSGIEKKPCFFDSDVFEYRIKPEDKQKPNVEVNVDVKVNNTSTSDGKIKITINGKECVFENAEQARMVLKG